MNYEIQTKSDLTAGVCLTVSFPENDLDKKALETLQHDWPEFLVPFHYRYIDGKIECTYRLENRTKLQYRFGTMDPQQYVGFWQMILQPLLDCKDWFLTPYSFVMDIPYLFVGRGGAPVSYLYIPSCRPCSDEQSLLDMVSELSKQNRVTNADLENKVLRAIMDDFRPKAFLELLNQAVAAPVREAVSAGAPVPETPVPAKAAADLAAPAPAPEEQKADAVLPSRPSDFGREGEIVIHFEGEKKKEKGKGWGFFHRKAAKERSESEKKQSFFKNTKEPQKQELLLGAIAGQEAMRDEGKSPDMMIREEDGLHDTDCEVTQLMDGAGCPCLRLIGDSTLPKEIPVDLQLGQAFTIGRFDVSVGRPQSDFEFDKRTRAVSRHHAAIERNSERYTIQDLSSSAGTFVNGQRIPPNMVCPLQKGDRISFGTGGADYIWEE